MKNVAVVLAGGIGSRFGSDKPKQFAKACGKTIIEQCIDAFQDNALIDEIAVVIKSEYFDVINEMKERNGWTKLTKVLDGGKERYDSSLSAINAYKSENCNLLLHDSVRPLVTDKIIGDVVNALKTYKAVDVAVPATDTIMKIDRITGNIDSVPDRSVLYHSQTPQAFHIDVISEAYNRALSSPDFKATDDCSVVLKYMPEVPIHVVEGDRRNIKLTYPDDIHIVELFLNNR